MVISLEDVISKINIVQYEAGSGQYKVIDNTMRRFLNMYKNVNIVFYNFDGVTISDDIEQNSLGRFLQVRFEYGLSSDSIVEQIGSIVEGSSGFTHSKTIIFIPNIRSLFIHSEYIEEEMNYFISNLFNRLIDTSVGIILFEQKHRGFMNNTLASPKTNNNPLFCYGKNVIYRAMYIIKTFEPQECVIHNDMDNDKHL